MHKNGESSLSKPTETCQNLYFLQHYIGKTFQQQREAMKQTIEEDKEPEKSGKHSVMCLSYLKY